ncbi:MAG TPA: coproporphyrinogen III oxidase [Cyanobacteria bacterium UBA11149]|nr:coproporphyrinogen III oxidase [Cyanobacteria bacterium UBA11367]HBE60133.1 coproporphyrinogen III oxidase [Cyanobacteria bacterium UBA11366]HBK64826.1 coproporphyrinogen III oxidase [Cyanobacteria bacterium UBA11166]HBR74109.1 coproporphyrinogen III oxidase [Cyanobacteria bacterium UBA11159]HBS72139.1 coproporphyrinogen III oxidase [Cyanobacteria bacterium UBA11153]HBW90690.1 coproporphyrinogen III oxidase [Cyanobacteria bacterium UBA11149]HCA93177.1 coproporphyrinogen III oxidase [Cyanob
MRRGKPTSAYIHIPFCRRRCYYCDFPISVVGHRAIGSNSGAIAEYVAVLCQEIKIAPILNKSLQTVFFGGGTPSLLSVAQLEKILDTLDGKIGIAEGAEISMEMDPGTFSIEQLQGYRKAGINRISLGVQAFQDELLSACGRSHDLNDIFAAVELIRQVGVPDLSLDLISGLPHQTMEDWQASLAAVLEIAPTHISCYDLVVESVTAFGRKYHPGENPLPADETTAQMYRLAREILTSAGYEHYEVSNYALPGHQCRHNRVYWENRPYYGFGMGAASYLEGCRFTRPRRKDEYYKWVEAFVQAGGVCEGEKISENDLLLETLMLGLRLADGLSLAGLRVEFGEKILAEIWQILQPYYCQGWVEFLGREGKVLGGVWGDNFLMDGRFRLSDPEGFLFSNRILADLFSRLEEG